MCLECGGCWETGEERGRGSKFHPKFCIRIVSFAHGISHMTLVQLSPKGLVGWFVSVYVLIFSFCGKGFFSPGGFCLFICFCKIKSTEL